MFASPFQWRADSCHRSKPVDSAVRIQTNLGTRSVVFHIHAGKTYVTQQLALASRHDVVLESDDAASVESKCMCLCCLPAVARELLSLKHL